MTDESGGVDEVTLEDDQEGEDVILSLIGSGVDDNGGVDATCEL